MGLEVTRHGRSQSAAVAGRQGFATPASAQEVPPLGNRRKLNVAGAIGTGQRARSSEMTLEWRIEKGSTDELDRSRGLKI